MKSLRAFILLLSIALLGLIAPAMAGAPMPDIPKGKGEQCVEDTPLMRTSHMDMLLHQRDETMRKGIRTKKHSLKECLDCHAVKENNEFVSVASPKHFCRVCHDYASVSIDCFQCHTSKPRAAFKPVTNWLKSPRTILSGVLRRKNSITGKPGVQRCTICADSNSCSYS